MLGQISIDDRGQNWIGGPEGLGAGARDLGRVILASQQTRIGTGYSRPLFVSSPADVAGTAAFAGRSEASTRYAWSGASHTSVSWACRRAQALYARASRSEDIAHAAMMRGSAVAMSNRRTCSTPNLRRPRFTVRRFP